MGLRDQNYGKKIGINGSRIYHVTTLLKALSVNEDTYSAVVVPAVLHKLYCSIVYCSIVRSVLEYACPVWAALPKYLDDAIESVQKRALRIILPHCHYDDALIQSDITALSQRREEACTNCIKRDCLSSPVLKCQLTGRTASDQANVFRWDKALRRFLHH